MGHTVTVQDRCNAKLQKPDFRWSDIWRSPLHDLPIRDEILYQYLPLAPDMEVLEIGPGSGFTAFRLARYVRRIMLLDLAQGTIEKLKHSLRGLDNLGFACADACDANILRQITRRFDALYAIDMFMFVSDPGSALKNLRGLLRPGGTLLLSWPNYPLERSKGLCYIQFSADLEAMLQRAGFESWEVYTLRLRPFAQVLFRIFHEWPRRLFRSLRGSRETRNAHVYDETWSYQHGRRLESLRWALHAMWALFFVVARRGGPCFERVPLTADCADGNLLLLARR